MAGYIGTIPVPQATQNREAFTATSNQTSFATLGYTPGFIDVYLNGVKLAAADYTATNGSDVVLASGAASGDILEVVAFSAFTVADQTFTGDTSVTNLAVTGTFTSRGIDDNADAVAITIDSSENVGIGTSSPDRILHLNNSGTEQNVRAKFSNGTTGEGASDGFEIGINASNPAEAVLVNYEASPMAFFTSATERMRIDSSGSVGIGTTSPSAPLTIKAPSNAEAIHVIGRSDDIGQIIFVEADGTTKNARIDARNTHLNIGTVTSLPLKFETNATERMRITSAGNVGIGTDSPARTLEVYSSQPAIKLNNGTNAFTIGTGAFVDGSNSLIFFDEGVGERMRLDASGNVGIGTSSPNTGLSVVTGSANGIELGQDSDASTDSARLFFSTSAGSNAIHSSSGAMRFFTGSTAGSSTGTERMRLTSGGTLQIAGGGNDNVGEINMGNTAQNANRFQVRHQSNAWYLKTVDSQALIFGTSNTERMRIDSSGNLLVGKTSTSLAVAGARILPTGQVYSTASGVAPFAANRLSSDGAIMELYKDTGLVGSIGTQGGDLIIDSSSSNHSGLRFSSPAILPRYNGALADNQVDLGQTSSNYRFKDLYLSGGVYLGGTGSANKMEDYEEGTYTPQFVSGTYSYGNRTGNYTKVGNLVSVNVMIQWSASSSGGNFLAIELPFTVGGASTAARYCGSIGYMSGVDTTTSYKQIAVTTSGSATAVNFYQINDNSAPTSLTDSSLSSSGEFQMSITYQTT